MPQNRNPLGSTVMYRVAGRTYPMKTVNGCKVCNHPLRTAIENYIIQGYSTRRAAEALPEGTDISAENIQNHFKQKHLPMEEEARAELLRRRALELQWDPEEGADRLVDHIGFLRQGILDVHTRMTNREIEPDIKDGIAMAKALAAIDIDQGTEEDLSMYVTGIRVVLEAAREHMDREQFALFSRDITEHPVIQAIYNATATQEAQKPLQVRAELMAPEA